MTTDQIPTVSVVVLAWRLVDELERCVAAVRAQTGAFDLDVIIVENGAPADVHAAAERSAPDRLVVSPVNRGYGGGCTLGIEASESDYVVLLNDDATPEPGWLDALVGAAEADPTIAAVSTLLLNDDRTVQEAGCRVGADGATHPVAGGLGVDEARDAGLLVARDVDYGSGAALLLRRSAVLAIGAFDARYEPAYYEDVDLQFRLRLAGHRVVFEPAAVAVHSSGLSTAGSSSFYREFLSGRSLHLFQRRWTEVLEAIPPLDDDTTSLAPVAEFGVADRPAPPLPETRLVYPGLEADFESWAFDRLAIEQKQLDHARAGLQLAQERHELAEVEHAELLRLREEHGAMRARQDDIIETQNALRRRVDQLEAEPLRRVARRVLGRKS